MTNNINDPVNSPKCNHSGHFFTDRNCPHQSTREKISIIAFHILTLGIPLGLYRITHISSSKLGPKTDDAPRQNSIKNLIKRFGEKTIRSEFGTYVGKTKNGEPHGQGKYTYQNGEVYEGQFENDKAHGQGKYTYQNGDVYEGLWKDSKKHGEGTYTFKNGDVYEGLWKEGKHHGQGTYTFQNGDVYEGQWENGNLISRNTHPS